MLNKIKTATSSQDREISLFCFEKDAELPNVFILGMFHGDEPEGEYIIEKFMAELEQEPPAGLHYNIYFVPCLNPDGKVAKTRVNANKVDLNRNYPTANFKDTGVSPSGVHAAGTPASEIETRFMIGLVETYKPAKILSIHSDLHLVDYDGPAKELAFKLSEACGYKLVENIGYPTNGSFGTWAGIERQIPLITLETWGAQTEEDFEKIWQETRPCLYEFIK